MKKFVLTLLIALFAVPAFALELALPVACEIGKNCWVQQYADHDKTEGSQDFTCGVASYDGHDGTDIRVLNTSDKVDVVAAAKGIVKAVRDSVTDNLVKTENDKNSVEKIECGNGVVISHGAGWETQYCHMRKGSVSVKAGDAVAVGHRLGEIGFSGNAAFPHVHLTVRKNGKSVDPFSADMTANCSDADRSLWNSEAENALAYKGTEVLALQWAPNVLTAEESDAGPTPTAPPSPDWPALVLYAQAINLRQEDVVKLTVLIPGQEPLVNSVVMKNTRAVQKLHVGKRMRGVWPLGIYVGNFKILRAGVVALEREAKFTIYK